MKRTDYLGEQSVLGGVLVWPQGDPYPPELERLEGHHFRDRSHKTIWEAMKGPIGRGETTDSVMVVDQMKAWGRGDLTTYVLDLEANCPSAANLGRWANIVIEGGRKRHMTLQLGDIALRASSDESYRADDMLEAVQMVARDAERGAVEDGGLIHISELLPGAVQAIADEAVVGPSSKTCRTGLTAIDNLLRMAPGDLTVVAGWTSIGKTAFVGQVCEHIALNGEHGDVAVFELEMTTASLVKRAIQRDMMASRERVEREASRGGLESSVSRLARLHLHIDDRTRLSMAQIRTALMRLPKIRAVMIDYLQLVRLQKADRNELALSDVVRESKEMAKEFDCHVILLSQLNRASRERKRPQLSDLRGSGGIEEHSDNVAFIYRDDYEGHRCDNPGEVEFIVAKQRAGPVGTVLIRWVEAFQLFENLGPVDKPQAELEL